MNKDLLLFLSKPEAKPILEYLFKVEDYRKRVTDMSIEMNILQSTISKMVIVLKERKIVEESISGRSAYLKPHKAKVLELLNIIDKLENLDDIV